MSLHEGPGPSLPPARRLGLTGTRTKKDMTELPPEIQGQMRALETLPDDQIDTTDVPEILDWSNARRGAFCRPKN